MEAGRILMQMLYYANSILTLQVCPCRCFSSPKVFQQGPFHRGREGERSREARRGEGERGKEGDKVLDLALCSVYRPEKGNAV